MSLIAAQLAQSEAADPDTSVWLTANAGSGKTRVLIDRVARLLIRGVDPQRILCLTYTKAAATEMQNRLFERLGKWAMLPEDKLRHDLAELGEGDRASDEQLRRARQLFAQAIDTPGGLRVQTIHAFCASVLRRFPLEARVSPRFRELDDRGARQLRDEVLEDLAAGLAPAAMCDLARLVDEASLDKVLGEMIRHRDDLLADRTDDQIRAAIGLPAGFDEQALLSAVFLGNEADLAAEIIAAQRRVKTGEAEATALEGCSFAMPDLDLLSTMEGIFLYKSGEKRGLAKTDRFPTKPAQKILGNRLALVHDWMLRVEAARDRRLALTAVERTRVLRAFARAFLAEYERRKVERGFLDFDDLIQKTRLLLNDRQVADWVLYRLDGGIDHILVDEAQDTSPDQWSVIDALTNEIFVGEGQSGPGRTLFVVGDKKQSIYSFQGADVRAFDRMRDHFTGRAQALLQPFPQLGLSASFRSAPNILRFVDNLFPAALHDAIGERPDHIPIHPSMPGRVDLWPMLEKAEKNPSSDWSEAVDETSADDPKVQLAEGLARQVKDLLAARTQVLLKDGPRALQPGDILILVQRRSDLFHELLRAFKAAGLPIAGADRLNLGAEIAVRDLTALLSFLVTPEDDLSLAAVLRSPLFGLSEDALYRLAQPRTGYLWQALRDARDTHPEVMAMIDDLRAQTDFLRPYDLVDRILTRHGGRKRLRARLGTEAEDGIDAFLQEAMAYEAREVPSLTGFLVFLASDEVQIKRQSDMSGQLIRIMTVHGAKGLEAPLVILPDTAQRPPSDRDRLLRPEGGPVLAKPRKADQPLSLTAVEDARKARSADEHMRLLYVAVTRAKSWLILAGTGEAKSERAWHRLMSEAMDRLGPTETLPGGVLRHEFGTWPDNAPPAMNASAGPDPLPDWMSAGLSVPDRPLRSLSPSSLGGPKVLPAEDGQDAERAKARGTALHRLLEHLPGQPAALWADLARRLIAEDDLRDTALQQAEAVLRDPALAYVFAPGTLAEVAVHAPWGDRRLFGSIDRLVVEPDRVLAVDFKSNRLVPDSAGLVPSGLLAQMGAYDHALEQIYPGRRIDLAILWTAVPRLMALDRDIVRLALQQAPIP